jgi:predicted phosphodiesterase
VLALPALEQAARGAPVFFPGDLTDSGSSLETGSVRRIVSLARPFVFVAGNHDSDTLEGRLARAGAIVLRANGRLLADGRRGPVVVRVAGLRVAGYPSPNERRRADGYRDRGAAVAPADQQRFTSWMLRLAGKVDVVLAHEPQLVAPALRIMRADRTLPPLLMVVGHTHVAGVDARDRVVAINGGSLGAGGTGNLSEGQNLGLAVVTFERDPFRPLAADTVTIDPGTGSARASRVRLEAATRPVPASAR